MGLTLLAAFYRRHVLGQGNVPEHPQEAVVFEPPDLLQRGKLHVFEAPPETARPSGLRLEQADD